MTNDMIWIDFETRSTCDLKNAGSYNYAKDETTDILCMSWATTNTDDIKLWVPFEEDVPEELLYAINNTTNLIAAHNAQFDRLIWNEVGTFYGLPPTDTDRWYCTAAQARCNALPEKLADLTRCILKSSSQKDFRGARLIKLLSIPQDDGTFNEDPELLQEMYEYCITDSEVMRKASLLMRPMSPVEHLDWVLNEDLNDRGIKVDTELAELAQNYASQEGDAIAQLLREVTNGAVTKHTQNKRIKDWLEPLLTPDAKDIFTTYKGNEKKFTLDKASRETFLAKVDENLLEVSDDVWEVVSLLDEGNKSSVAKFTRMTQRAGGDDRVRGAFVFAGASQTLRFASRGLQLHNFKRDCHTADEAETTIAEMRKGKPIPDVMGTLSKMLRPALIPARGHSFVVGDWSAIEGRGLPWLSNSRGGEKVLNIFRRDEDLYLHTCAAIGIEDRQIGKVAALSLGYGGSVGAFAAMGRAYNVFLPEHQVKGIVDNWRAANPWAVKFWNDLHDAALSAIRFPNQEFSVGHVTYKYIEHLLGGTLVCGIAGQMSIQYPYCTAKIVSGPYGDQWQITAVKANWKPKADAKTWPRVTLWRGLLAENITQAFCALLLRNTVRECSVRELPIVAHVHDEVILEVPTREAELYRVRLQNLMEATPAWAEGLPLKAKPVILQRYGGH